MNKFFYRLALSFTVAGLMTKASAATVSITPTAISNTYAGTITFQVAGLTNGETVFVQKFLDANSNGIVDAGDFLCQAFKLVDGKAAVFHDGATAVTNTIVPGDTDPAVGQITAALNIHQSGFEQTLIGSYLYVVTSPTGNFPPVTNSFVVTNFPFAQSISGSVSANGTNVPDAAVLLFEPAGQNLNPEGGAVADSSGHYRISAAPGNYVLVAFESNFVANAGAANVTLAAGVNLSTNLFLISADQTISGSFIEASNSATGLPGVLVPMESTGGLLTIAFTGTNGDFTAGVTSSQWKVEISDQAAAFHNYIRAQKEYADTTTGSVSGVIVSLPKASAIFYGTVKDGLNQPLPGISLASSDFNLNLEQNVVSDANGNYFAGVLSDPSTF